MRTTQYRQILYGVAAVVGLVVTAYFNVTYAGDVSYLAAWFANLASSSAAVDLIVAAVAASVFMVVGSRPTHGRLVVQAVLHRHPQPGTSSTAGGRSSTPRASTTSSGSRAAGRAAGRRRRPSVRACNRSAATARRSRSPATRAGRPMRVSRHRRRGRPSGGTRRRGCR